jgi:hypothetical protein
METIGRVWAKADPVRAMEFASTRPGELGSALANHVLKNWAGQNLKEAAGWLAGADAPTRNRFSPAFVEALAKNDASGALAWCESNLAGGSLAQAVGDVAKGAAQSDVNRAYPPTRRRPLWGHPPSSRPAAASRSPTDPAGLASMCPAGRFSEW